ncbi:MAG: PAC2 family protein [Candidatus Bathyarchaeota archaeon]|nr:PAC2 family protein [Candidatus Bathyarchaeota archaeon]
MNEEIRIDWKIDLHNANMVVGLEGWGNAGKVSTFTVKYLADKLGAKKLGEIPPESFHSYLIQRPVVAIKEGIILSYIPPKNDLFYWRDKEGKADLVLLLGYEPHHNWPRYTEAVLRVAEETGVNRIYTIGGFLADVSHKSEIPITSSTNNKKIVAELKNVGLELTNYSGPTTVYSEILWRSKKRELDVVSIWAAVPMYVGGIYPKAAYRILEKLTRLIGIDLDLTDLKKKAETFKGQFDREVASQREMRRLIEDLRGRTSREKEPTYIF